MKPTSSQSVGHSTLTTRLRLSHHPLLLALLAAVAVGVPLVLLGRPPDRLPPDGTGKLKRVLVSSHTQTRMPLNGSFIQELEGKLGPGCEILIAAEPDDHVSIDHAGHPAVRDLPLPAGSHVTVWPQDPFVVVHRGNRPVKVLASHAFDRAQDLTLAAAAAKALGLPFAQSSLDFYGGNLVAAENEVFIGADTIALNAARLDIPPEDVQGRFAREFGHRVLVVGPSPQPVDHIDMVLTPLGNRRFAVADPRWGGSVLDELAAEDPAQIAAFEELCLMGFGNAVRQLRADADTRARIQPPPFGGASARAVARSRDLGPWADGLAEWLTARGYQVVRIPYLPPPADCHYDEEAWLGACYPDLSYNNVILEGDPALPLVYLPEYGLPGLDEAASSAWSAAGFTVVPIRGLLLSAMYGGGLRCSLKVLERDKPGHRPRPGRKRRAGDRRS